MLFRSLQKVSNRGARTVKASAFGLLETVRARGPLKVFDRGARMVKASVFGVHESAQAGPPRGARMLRFNLDEMDESRRISPIHRITLRARGLARRRDVRPTPETNSSVTNQTGWATMGV